MDVDVVTQPAGPQALPPALFAHCTFKPTILAPSKLLVRKHQCDIGPAPETRGTPLRAPKEIKGQRREKQKTRPHTWLHVRDKERKQPRHPPAGEQIGRLASIRTTEYYAANKRNEALECAITRNEVPAVVTLGNGHFL